MKSWAGGPSSLPGRVLTNRQMKRFSTPLVIRETLIKATARCYWGSIRMAKTKTKWIVSKADQDPEHTNLLYTAGGVRHLQGKWHGMCNNAVCGEKTSVPDLNLKLGQKEEFISHDWYLNEMLLEKGDSASISHCHFSLGGFYKASQDQWLLQNRKR